MDLALNNLQWLIFLKTKSHQTKTGRIKYVNNSSNTGALGNAEYPFIFIAPWSTLAWRRRT